MYGTIDGRRGSDDVTFSFSEDGGVKLKRALAAEMTLVRSSSYSILITVFSLLGIIVDDDGGDGGGDGGGDVW
jgi:hypothetical protein